MTNKHENLLTVLLNNTTRYSLSGFSRAYKRYLIVTSENKDWFMYSDVQDATFITTGDLLKVDVGSTFQEYEAIIFDNCFYCTSTDPVLNLLISAIDNDVIPAATKVFVVMQLGAPFNNIITRSSWCIVPHTITYKKLSDLVSHKLCVYHDQAFDFEHAVAVL
jgi:hypothetical protein